MPLTDYQCKRIVSLWTETDENLAWTSMERILAMEGIITTCQTIKSIITRWQKTGCTGDCPRSGPPKNVPEDHIRCIDDAMAANDELTASDKDILTKKFGAQNVLCTARTIARHA